MDRKEWVSSWTCRKVPKQQIFERELHYQLNSVEVGTNVIKPKYKLVGKFLTTLNVYVAFPTTSKDYGGSHFSVCCDHVDWDWVEPSHLAKWQRQNSKTYININNREALTVTEVASLISRAHLEKAALLSEAKFGEFRRVCMRFPDLRNPIPDNHKKWLVEVAATSDEKRDEILRKYKLV